MILRDLILGLTQGRWNRKGFSDRLAVDLSGEAVKGSVSWVVFFMAMATRIAATTACGGDGASTHIAQLGHLLLNGGSLHLQYG
jgi:hypothetical protein